MRCVPPACGGCWFAATWGDGPLVVVAIMHVYCWKLLDFSDFYECSSSFTFDTDVVYVHPVRTTPGFHWPPAAMPAAAAAAPAVALVATARVACSRTRWMRRRPGGNDAAPGGTCCGGGPQEHRSTGAQDDSWRGGSLRREAPLDCGGGGGSAVANCPNALCDLTASK
jgi:hypothetical protein